MSRRIVTLALFTALSCPLGTHAQVHGDPDVYRFEYDETGNLISRTEETGGRVDTTTLPPDASGRNRPSSVGQTPLEWDANGNLTRKGNLFFSYDFRNRLMQVRNSLGQVLAVNTYDAFGRRVRQVVGDDVIETVWSRWQPTETYANGILTIRRIYGQGLDEIVLVEWDLDADGVLEQSYLPLYDSTGNLALVADSQGKPIERYSYSPYGKRRVYVDLTPPEIEQVRVVGDEIWVEISEMVNTTLVMEGTASGAITLLLAGGTPVSLTTAPFVLHSKRHRLNFVPEPIPQDGTEVTLFLEQVVISDLFLNQSTADFTVTFDWPPGDAVVFDNTPPKIVEIGYKDAVVEVEFSEEVDPATASTAIQTSGYVTDWSVRADRYRLIAAAPIPEGTHDFLVTTGLKDLVGQSLADSFSFQLHVYPDTPSWVAYRVPDSREVSESTIANEFGFHGLPHDPVTGFIYMRNRYFDPELGRFITADPMGYADGPSMYQFAGNDPINKRDPLGLLISTGERELTLIRQIIENSGRPDLAATLGLDDGYLDIPGSLMLEWAGAAGGDPTIKLLFKSIIDQLLEIDLRLVAEENLESFVGAKTSPPKIRETKFGKKYFFDIRLDPSIIANVRLRLQLDKWSGISLDVAVVHEIGHAAGTKEKGLTDTTRVLGMAGPTDQIAVDREDSYRMRLGLEQRRDHVVPAVYCPRGAWESDLCQMKMFCAARGIPTTNRGCQDRWQAYRAAIPRR